MTAEEIARAELSNEDLDKAGARDEGIDFSDIPEVTDNVGAFRGRPEPFRKRISILFDPDVYLWLESFGESPDKRINKILRAHSRAELRKEVDRLKEIRRRDTR